MPPRASDTPATENSPSCRTGTADVFRAGSRFLIVYAFLPSAAREVPASAALLLNALKAMAGIRGDLDLIANQVIEPISALKIQSLGHHNPRLHSDEVLIALAISGLTNPLAELAREQLGSLRGCDAHFSVIISEEDIKLYKRLGIHVSCEPKYESKRLYHK